MRADFLHELDLIYNNEKLKDEVKNIEFEPYFKDNPNTDSWFAGPKSWLYADIPDKPNTEIDSVRKQLKELLGTNNVIFAVIKQKANTSVPVHSDKSAHKYQGSQQIKCAVNIQLNDPVGPINFPAYGLTNYKCALLNVFQEHGVPVFENDRLFIKFKILDISYQEALDNYLKNKK
jgi:hypothetical protein